MSKELSYTESDMMLAEKSAKEHLQAQEARFGTKLHYILIPDNVSGCVKYGYLRQPTKAQMGAYMALQGNDPLLAQETLLRSIFVAGHPDLLNDEQHLHLFLSTLTTFATSDFLPVALGKVGR